MGRYQGDVPNMAPSLLCKSVMDLIGFQKVHILQKIPIEAHEI